MNIIRREQGQEAYNKNSVVGKKLLSKPEGDVVHLEIQAGASLPVHTTAVDVFFYVLEGEGEIEIGNEREKVRPDTLVESPKDIPHGLHNTGSSLFRVMVVKTPRPA
jgi:quercetin dioxygenase-like cupin family protein